MSAKSNKVRILVVHGPNLQLLGSREPQVYGRATLAQINARLKKAAAVRGVSISCIQSNHEGVIVDAIGKSPVRYKGIIINPAAFTHTSVAIRDAVAAVGLPVVEVHLSNIHTRESFRHTSLISPVAQGVVMGFGVDSYILGLHALVDILTQS